MDVVFLVRRSIACCGGPPNELDAFCMRWMPQLVGLEVNISNEEDWRRHLSLVTLAQRLTMYLFDGGIQGTGARSALGLGLRPSDDMNLNFDVILTSIQISWGRHLTPWRVRLRALAPEAVSCVHDPWG